MARDEAERRWREAKPPAPLPKRLDWADTKLRKAQAALTRVRLELDAFDADTEKRRAEICMRIQEAEEWYHWRRKQLDDLHEEAAESAPCRRHGAQAGGGTEEVRKQIRDHMLPEMQAILEVVPEGSDLHERLALFAAGLADAETRLGDRGRAEGPVRYNLGDDDSQHDDWEGEYQGMAGDGETQGEGPEGGRQEGKAARWRPEGAGRWSRSGATKGGDQQTGTCADATDGTRTPAHGNGGSGAGKGASVGDGSVAKAPGEMANADTDDGDGARAGKHRRRQTEAEAKEAERTAQDSRRAQELRQQLDHASAMQERSYRDGNGGFGSETALSLAAQSFVLHVQRVQAQADQMGVEPRAQDGRTLLELSPMELKQWAQDNLGDDDMRD